MKRNGDGVVMWRELAERHKDALARKYDKIGMLRALIEEYDKLGDIDYTRDLRARLRSVECQLKAMKP